MVCGETVVQTVDCKGPDERVGAVGVQQLQSRVCGHLWTPRQQLLQLCGRSVKMVMKVRMIRYDISLKDDEYHWR